MKICLYDVYINKYLRKLYHISKRLHLPFKIRYYICYIHFKFLKHRLYPYLQRALKNVNDIRNKGINNSFVIWVFWWQGHNKMPKLVKECIRSIRYYSCQYKVILIDKYNISKYIHIPNFILKKLETNEITLTYFSDILRFYLLQKYGGLWCDSTLYCTNKITSQYFNYLYTSGGQYGSYPRFADGNWSSFLIGGYKQNALFQFMCDFFNNYWSNNNYQLSYFMTDFALYYAYQHNVGNFKSYVEIKAQAHNPSMWKMIPLLNKKYSLNKLREITKNTNMFKLTYKMHINSNSNLLIHHLLYYDLYKKI